MKSAVLKINQHRPKNSGCCAYFFCVRVNGVWCINLTVGSQFNSIPFEHVSVSSWVERVQIDSVRSVKNIDARCHSVTINPSDLCPLHIHIAI